MIPEYISKERNSTDFSVMEVTPTEMIEVYQIKKEKKPIMYPCPCPAGRCY